MRHPVYGYIIDRQINRHTFDRQIFDSQTNRQTFDRQTSRQTFDRQTNRQTFGRHINKHSDRFKCVDRILDKKSFMSLINEKKILSSGFL